jgi:hypothetical protein
MFFGDFVRYQAKLVRRWLAQRPTGLRARNAWHCHCLQNLFDDCQGPP